LERQGKIGTHMSGPVEGGSSISKDRMIVMSTLFNLAHTYSIVAFDPESKQLGAAMQTHSFEACNSVVWVQPGIGAVASQAGSDPFYAFVGFEMMRLGKSAPQTLESLRACDPDVESNQVAIIDVRDQVAAYTGSRCIPEAGHQMGHRYSCQANLMLKDTVWAAMAEAFEGSAGNLVDRLLAALEAAEREGGDLRGAQSAVIKVVSSERVMRPWDGYYYDFRVYDHAEPLKELRRLVDIKRIYLQGMQAQDILLEPELDDEKIARSMQQFDDAVNRLPDVKSRHQNQCFYSLALFNIGKKDEAIAKLRAVFDADPMWREVVARIIKVNPDKPYAQILDDMSA
jgi:uncharacterized Ntn-hydrolase superfamily protein